MKSTILAFSLLSLITGSTFAASSVAVVDLTTVFQKVPQGSAAFQTLKSQLAPQLTQLQTQTTALQNNKTLSKAQMTDQEQTLQQNIQNFQKSASEQEQALLSTFSTDVKNTVANIAKQNHYDVVISDQNTLYNTDESDITQAVVSALQQAASSNS